MNKVIIDSERCKGCGLCMDSCPEGLISMSDRINRLGFRHAIFLDGDGARCKSCVLCALICPDVAIEVYK